LLVPGCPAILFSGNQATPWKEESVMKVLVPKDVAKLLDLTSETVRRLAREGKLPAHRTPSGRFVFLETEVLGARSGASKRPEK
jgi:excisionase family DNA binding protein